jgi:hypothetical protein
VRKLISLLPPLLLLLASLAALQFIVFWAADWLYTPRLWWLTVILCGGALTLPVIAWYYFGRSQAPLMVLALVVLLIGLGSIFAARSLDLSRLSYSQGFTVEITMMVVPAVAYFIAAGVSHAVQRSERY